MINEFITNYGMEIISSALVAIVGFIGTAVKNIYQKYIDDKTKEKVVETVVKAVNQLYSDLDGDAKLEKAIENIIEMLNEKGIAISEIEIRMLIESAVNEFKSSVKAKKEGDNNGNI